MGPQHQRCSRRRWSLDLVDMRRTGESGAGKRHFPSHGRRSVQLSEQPKCRLCRGVENTKGPSGHGRDGRPKSARQLQSWVRECLVGAAETGRMSLLLSPGGALWHLESSFGAVAVDATPRSCSRAGQRAEVGEIKQKGILPSHQGERRTRVVAVAATLRRL